MSQQDLHHIYIQPFKLKTTLQVQSFSRLAVERKCLERSSVGQVSYYFKASSPVRLSTRHRSAHQHCGYANLKRPQGICVHMVKNPPPAIEKAQATKYFPN